ncbi:MAG: hypothetical protein R6V44_12875 [Paracoccaceae bacterium]
MRRGVLALERFERAASPHDPERPPAPAVRREAEAAREAEARLARARGEGRAEGYAAGVAEAEARADAALRLALSEIGERIEDCRLAMAERREAVGAAAAEICEALLTGLAPAFARAGLAAEVAAAVAEGLEERTGAAASPVVRVSPDQAEAVSSALAGAGVAAEITPDPELGDLGARIDWGDGADAVDLDAAIGAARIALDRHLETQRRRPAHG